jgi:hypothetical protein
MRDGGELLDCCGSWGWKRPERIATWNGRNSIPGKARIVLEGEVHHLQIIVSSFVAGIGRPVFEREVEG